MVEGLFLKTWSGREDSIVELFVISVDDHYAETTRYDGGEITMRGFKHRWQVSAWSRYMFDDPTFDIHVAWSSQPYV